MDMISELPEELLLRILSFLPSAKDVSRTMVVSKRWQPLWRMVPKLVFDDHSYHVTEHHKFSRFVDRSLLLHKAPILETLHFKVSQTCGGADIPVWTRAADRLSVRELIIEIGMGFSVSPVTLPRSLYTMCTTLVTLLLKNVGLADVSAPVSFPSLLNLSLVSVKYPGDDFVKRFLSGCPVLENLFVAQCPGDNVTNFTVRVPSLKTLMMFKSLDRNASDADGSAIDAPSLEFLYIVGGIGVIENEMPNLVMADINAACGCYSKVMGSITSATRFRRWLRCFKAVHSVGNVFRRRKHLECFNTLTCLLRYSPKLQSLEFKKCHHRNEPRRRWIEPSSVPECLLSSLETLKWVEYEGSEEEKEVAAFILRYGSCLKNVTISSSTSTDRDKKLEMIKELSFLSRRSPNCHLTFD